jgi:enoyl-CoA hydratase/carnithine racemase
MLGNTFAGKEREMQYETVRVESEDAIGTITLNRPDKFNTFSTGLARELGCALYELDNDAGVRVVVIRGEGKHFCAGIDLTEMAGKSPVELREWIREMDAHNLTIARMRKPVVASVHGAAVANGLGLACCCDLTVASEDAKFGTTAINVGLFCFGPSVPLAQCVGKKRALELLLTGKVIDAAKALEYGIVNTVVPREKLVEETASIAGELVKKSPVAIRMGRSAYYAMANMNYEEALAYAGESFALLCSSGDAHEGVDAFLNKRDPKWKER